MKNQKVFLPIRIILWLMRMGGREVSMGFTRGSCCNQAIAVMLVDGKNHNRILFMTAFNLEGARKIAENINKECDILELAHPKNYLPDSPVF